MEKSIESEEKSQKTKDYELEFEKLSKIFEEVEPQKKQLVEGLIENAAFLYSEDMDLERKLKKSGLLKIHPQHPELQKILPAATQYLKNLNTYSTVIKTLNGVLSKNEIEEDDGMDEFE